MESVVCLLAGDVKKSFRSFPELELRPLGIPQLADCIARITGGESERAFEILLKKCPACAGHSASLRWSLCVALLLD